VVKVKIFSLIQGTRKAHPEQEGCGLFVLPFTKESKNPIYISLKGISTAPNV